MHAASTSELSPVVATSIFSSLQSRMGVVHRDGKMGAFAGPPGIGKTTAIESFVRANPRQVARPLLRRDGATATTILQAMLSAVRRDGLNSANQHVPSAAWRVESLLENTIKDWRRWAENLWQFDDPPVRLSLIFDEAQTLSSKMIDMLRFWSDGADGVPGLAIIFVGNDQFRLDADEDGPSFLSAPVASRTGRNRKTWTYEDVTDEDVRRVAEARGVEDVGALDALVAHCRLSTANRDLRQLGEMLDRAFQLAGDGPVSASLVSRLLAA